MSLKFHQQAWNARYAQLGDESEQKFESLNPNCARFGLNRPPVNLANVPAFIRYMPDYLLYNRLVECMGVGKDQLLKLKLDKMDQLHKWGRHLPVYLFVWDSSNRRWCEISTDDLAAVAAVMEIKEFPEGKPYYSIPTDALAVVWHADD